MKRAEATDAEVLGVVSPMAGGHRNCCRLPVAEAAG